jgi:hypothetical protein
MKWSLLIRAILFCVLFTCLLAASSFLTGLVPSQFKSHAFGILGSAIALLLTLGILRYEKKSFSDFGLLWRAGTLKRFIIGFLIGLVLTSAMLLCLVLLTDLRIQVSDDPDVSQFLIGALALLLLSKQLSEAILS